MASSSTLRIDGLSGLQEALAKFPRATFEEMKKTTVNSLASFEAAMGPRMARGIPANARAGDGVSVRTGALRRSWRRTVAGHDVPSLVGIATLGTKGAATLEMGDPNRVPRSSRFLAIPLPAARTAAGVPRVLSPRQFAAGGSALVTTTGKNGKLRSRKVTTGTKPTFIRRARTGPGYVVYLRQGRDAAPIPIYRLVPSASIPAHLGFFNTWKRMLPHIQADFGHAIARAMAKATGK